MKGGNFALLSSMAVIFAIAFCSSNVDAEQYPIVKVGGFIGVQYVYDESEKASPNNELRFRHARMHAVGKLSDNLNGLIQFEAKSGTPSISVAFINLNYFPNTEIRVGRIKSPLGIEILGHPLKNPTIDVSNASKAIWPGCDMGVQVTYKHEYATGTVACQNGNKMAFVDNNDAKNICGKLITTPIEGLGVGGSFYTGKLGSAELSTTRYGAEVNYKKGSLWLRGEFLGAENEQATGSDVASIGYYATVAYKLLPQVEAAVRYDAYDPDTDTDDNEKTDITVGLSYYFTPQGWNRVSVNYEIRDDQANEKVGNFLTFQVQVLF